MSRVVPDHWDGTERRRKGPSWAPLTPVPPPPVPAAPEPRGPIDNAYADGFRDRIRALQGRTVPAPAPPEAWPAADDAELLRQQLIDRAAVELVCGDQDQAAAYLALLPASSRHSRLLLSFGVALLAAERRPRSRGDF